MSGVVNVVQSHFLVSRFKECCIPWQLPNWPSSWLPATYSSRWGTVSSPASAPPSRLSRTLTGTPLHKILGKKMSTLTPIHQLYKHFNQNLSNFHLSTAQVCNPEVWHLLLLPDLQVQARQPGFQVNRTAKATSTCGKRWSRPWVYVSFIIMDWFSDPVTCVKP